MHRRYRSVEIFFSRLKGNYSDNLPLLFSQTEMTISMLCGSPPTQEHCLSEMIIYSTSKYYTDVIL